MIHQNNLNKAAPRFRIGWNSWLVSGHTRYELKDKFKIFCSGETVIDALDSKDAIDKWKLAFPNDFCWVKSIE